VLEKQKETWKQEGRRRGS